jgi:hypothetical protein
MIITEKETTETRRLEFVKTALKSAGSTIAELSAETGWSLQTIKRYVKKGIAEGALVESPGYWQPASYVLKSGNVQESNRDESKTNLTRASGVTPESAPWLWPGRIPFGKLTLFAGYPGVGKNHAAMYVAAQASTGAGWCDSKNTTGPLEAVIISDATECDVLTTRLMTAGANLSKVGFLDGFTVNTIPALREMLENNPDVKLVIIDPLPNYLKDKSELEVRLVLSPLARLAEKTGAAIVLVSHLNKRLKKDDTDTMGEVMVARAAWWFEEDKADGFMKMLPLKMNCGPNAGGLVYDIVPKENEINGKFGRVGCLQWKGSTAGKSA